MMPTTEDVEKIVTWITSKRGYYEHFFENPRTTAIWIKPLREKGFFSAPPPMEQDGKYVRFPIWSESRYLARVAAEAPQEVLETILSIRTDNPRILEDFVAAGLKMPPETAAKLLPIVKAAIELPYQLLLQDKLEKLLLHLLVGNQTETALAIADVALDVFTPTAESPGGTAHTISEARAHFDGHDYLELITALQDTFLKKMGNRWIALLAQKLSSAIRLENEAEERSAAYADMSYIWRPAIEDHEQNHYREHAKDVLVSGLRTALEKTGQQRPEDLQRAVSEVLEKEHFAIFFRLKLHCYRLFPQMFIAGIRKVLTSKDSFDDYTIRHEYYHLMSVAFEFIGKDTQMAVLDLIAAGPDVERYSDRIEKMHGKRPTTSELADYVGVWKRDRLSAIERVLPQELKTQYDEYVRKYGRSDHPDFVSYSKVGWGFSVPSSYGKDVLKKLSPKELIDSFANFKAPEDTWPGSPDEGAGRELQEVIKEDPAKYAGDAEEFSHITNPVFLFHVLWGFAEGWKAKKEFGVMPVLALCRRLIDLSHETEKEGSREAYISPSEVKTAVCNLLEELLTAKDHVVSDPKILEDIRDLLLLPQLLSDAEPTVEQEEHYGKDPIHYALNCNRGRALRVLLQYIIRSAQVRYPGQKEVQKGIEPKVLAALENRLAIETSPAAHAVFGWFFNTLFSLDQAWTTKNLPLIFPESKPKQWWASWAGYVLFNDPHKQTYAVLKDRYRKAVAELSIAPIEDRSQEIARHIAGHVMIFYWNDIESLEAGSLASLFFSVVTPEVRGYAIWYLWTALHQQHPDVQSPEWKRLRQLWENRLEVGLKLKDKAAAQEELSHFVRWLPDVPESLREIEKLVTITLQFAKRFEIGEVQGFLATKAEEYPDITIRLLRVLIEDTGLDYWTFGNMNVDDVAKIVEAGEKSGEATTRSAAQKIRELYGHYRIELSKKSKS